MRLYKVLLIILSAMLLFLVFSCKNSQDGETTSAIVSEKVIKEEKTTETTTSTINITDLKLLIESIIEESMISALYFQGLQGGYIFPIGNVLELEEKNYNVTCLYYKGMVS